MWCGSSPSCRSRSTTRRPRGSIPWATEGSVPLAHRFVGDGEILFLHANGFCKETWEPVVGELRDRGHVLVDQWGHGESPAPPPPFDWWDQARDLLRLIDDLRIEPRIGVGHSSGGSVVTMAEILRPGTFERLVLIEPVMPPPPWRRTEDHPLVARALSRRTSFPSREAAMQAYRGKGPFASWEERALRCYVSCGMREEADGSVTLRCRPEVEAEFYRTHSVHGVRSRLGEVLCPVTLVAGADSHPEPSLDPRPLTDLFPRASLEIVFGATHLVPMERPAAVAELIGIDDG